MSHRQAALTNSWRHSKKENLKDPPGSGTFVTSQIEKKPQYHLLKAQPKKRSQGILRLQTLQTLSLFVGSARVPTHTHTHTPQPLHFICHSAPFPHNSVQSGAEFAGKRILEKERGIPYW